MTKYSIEKDGGFNHASKKDIVRGRHSFCLSYLARWQQQLHRSDTSAVLQISWSLMDEYCYQPNRLGRIIDKQRKDMDLVAPSRKVKGLMRCAESIILLAPPLTVDNMASEILLRCEIELMPIYVNNLLQAKCHLSRNLWAVRCPPWHGVQDGLKGH